jgi:hypothetical protein
MNYSLFSVKTTQPCCIQPALEMILLLFFNKTQKGNNIELGKTLQCIYLFILGRGVKHLTFREFEPIM